MFLINSLGSVDIAFFIISAIILALIVGFYFLIPLVNAKQYKAQRENLKKREEEFNANLKKNKELREAQIQLELNASATETVNEAYLEKTEDVSKEDEQDVLDKKTVDSDAVELEDGAQEKQE